MENKIDYTEDEGICSCNYCGAYAKTIDKVEHHKTCTRAKGMKQYDGMFEEV